MPVSDRRSRPVSALQAGGRKFEPNFAVEPFRFLVPDERRRAVRRAVAEPSTWVASATRPGTQVSTDSRTWSQGSDLKERGPPALSDHARCRFRDRIAVQSVARVWIPRARR